MLIFKMPRDPSLEISCIEIVLDDLVYVISSSEGFLTTDTDYVAWFSESSVGPIVDDCLVSTEYLGALHAPDGLWRPI